MLDISPATLKHLIAGRRLAPEATNQRLIEIVRGELNQLQTILAELEAMPERPKKNPVTHINRKAASDNEQAARLNK